VIKADTIAIIELKKKKELQMPRNKKNASNKISIDVTGEKN
jgi:hypothetical protein